MSWCACINFWQPLNLEQYDSIRKMASEIHAYAPDARVLTTYYCGMNSLPSVLITYFFRYDFSCLFLSCSFFTAFFVWFWRFSLSCGLLFSLGRSSSWAPQSLFYFFSFLLFPPLLFSCVCVHSWCYVTIS